jgi:hypothetical protein
MGMRHHLPGWLPVAIANLPLIQSYKQSGQSAAYSTIGKPNVTNVVIKITVSFVMTRGSMYTTGT